MFNFEICNANNFVASNTVLSKLGTLQKPFKNLQHNNCNAKFISKFNSQKVRLQYHEVGIIIFNQGRGIIKKVDFIDVYNKGLNIWKNQCARRLMVFIFTASCIITAIRTVEDIGDRRRTPAVVNII